MRRWGMTTAAIVGCGDISALHLAAVAENPRVDLAAVCDVDPGRARAAGESYRVPWFTDHRDLLAAVRPDVVHVTTPHDQHVPVALSALDAGCHVLTEKPIAASVAQARLLVDRATASDRSVGVVFQNRYNPTSMAIRSVLDSGILGRLVGARAAVWWSRTPAYYAAAPWRGRWAEGGGGTLINQSIHTLDLLLWFLGPARTVRGRAGTLALADVIEVEDTASVVLEHATGARSTFFATNAHHANDDVELEITGEAGVVSLSGGEARVRDADGERLLAVDSQAGGQRSYWGLGHALLIDDFHARLGHPDRFWIGLADGLAALEVLRSVYAQSGILPPGADL